MTGRVQNGVGRWWRALACAAPMLAAACNTDMTPASEVIRPRLYGVRIEVEGDPGRASPAPGESFVLRQSIAMPGEPDAARYDMELALCLGIRTNNGLLACAGEVALPVAVETVSPTELRIGPIAVPELEQLSDDPEFAEALASIDQLAIFGALCVDGKVERVEGKSINTDPTSQLFRCVDNEDAPFPEAFVFTFSVFLDLGAPGQRNQNPAFACDPEGEGGACVEGLASEAEASVPGSIVLVSPEKKQTSDGLREVRVWRALDGDGRDLPWLGCRGDTRFPLQIPAKSGEHLVRVRFDASDRERFAYDVEEYGEIVRKETREELLVSHAVTQYGGELDGHFSVVEREVSDGRAEIEFAWEPPGQGKGDAEIPDDGRLVRFFFGLRDQRGGFDFTTRELCLLPPE